MKARERRLSLAGAVLSMAAAACSSSDGPSSHPGDDGGVNDQASPTDQGSPSPDASESSAADAPFDGGTCPLAGFLADGGDVCKGAPQLGSMVTPACAAGSPPAAAGGALPEGTYVLTKSTYYVTSCPSPLTPTRVTRYMCNGQWAIELDRGGTMTAYAANTTLQGTSIVFHFVCPTVFDETVGYTMSGSTLTLLIPDTMNTGTLVDEYALQ
jgi:hypothetical protein